jgi:hypothetical protein
VLVYNRDYVPIVRCVSNHEEIVAPATGSQESIVVVLPNTNGTMIVTTKRM